MSSTDIKMDSVFAKGLVCQNCQSELVTDFISSSQSAEVVIRCGNCGEAFSPLQDSGVVDKNAWRSLWLGLASLVLICFTGIPAMYFGIKSLLRGRYTRTRPQDRRAAVAGTILGGLFGVFGSFCVFGLGGVVLVTYLSNANATTTEQTRHVLDGLATMNMPDELTVGRATKMLGSSIFRFGDNEDKNKANLRFDFMYFPPAMAGSVTTLNSQLRNEQLNSEATYKEVSEELLKWDLCGRTIGVTKIVLEETRDQQPATEVCLYYGFSSVKPGIFAVAFMHRPVDSGLSEQQIRELIESITPREKIDVSHRWKELAKFSSNEAEKPDDQEPVKESDGEPADESDGPAENAEQQARSASQ